MKLLKAIYKRPVTIVFSIILAILIGVVSATNMAINLLPDISFPYLSIKTIYVGADAETVDKNVTQVLDDSLSSIGGIHNLSTYSIDNASIVILEFDYGTNLSDKEIEVNKKIESTTLPADCEKPQISQIDINGQSVVSLTITGDDFNEVIDKSIGLKKALLGANGVGEVTVSGEPTKTIKITPINGLEMASGFLVSELLKDKSLDIPLGEIKDENGKISINNETSAKSIEAIKSLTVSATLQESYIASFKSVQETIKSIEDMNTDDLEEMKKDCMDIRSFISELEGKTNTELDDFVSNLNLIKTLVETVENNTAGGLKLMWSQVLKNLFEDENFKNLSDDELHQMADKYSVSYDLLKWLQDNSSINPDTGKTYAEEKWDKIVLFRTKYPDEILDKQYAELFYDIDLIPNDANDPDYKTEDEIGDIVALVKVINVVYLDTIVDKMKNNEDVTNGDYASLFITTTKTYNVPLNSLTMKLIRDSHFESNYEIFYNYKLNHQHEDVDDDKNPIIKGDSISNADFMTIYNSFEFDSEFALKPTEKLLEFVRTVDFTSSTIKFTVGEAADVEYCSEYETRAYFNGQAAIQMDIYGNSGCNTTSIAKECQNIMNDFNNSNPTVTVKMLNNQANFINESLSNALVSLVIGMVLAVLVIYLFLRKVKSSLIIAVSMPLSVLLTLGCLYLMGITLNMVSVGGIAVGIGMLVDNSIVVLESITSEKSKGKSVLEASIDGVKLVLGSLIGSTLTSICVFFPILLINGLTREIFADLAWAVIFSLSWSLVVAITVIPALFCLFFKKEEIIEEKEETKLFTKIKNWYSKTLRKILVHRKTTILVSMLIFAASIGLIFTCSIEFLPSIDQHKIELSVKFSSTDSPEYCQKKTMEAYNIINENIDNINYSAVNVGYSGLVYTTQNGTILLEMKDNTKKTKLVIEDIREVLAEKGFTAHYQIQELDGVVASIVGGTSGVSVTVLGEDVDTLKEIATKVEEEVKNYQGIKNASDNMLESSTSYTLTFNHEKLAEKEVDYQSLVQTLRIGLAGYTVSTIETKDDKLDVIVSFDNETFTEYYEGISKFIVGFDENKDIIYLEDVCEIKEVNGRHVIRKNDGKNELTITVEPFGIDTNTASKYLKESTNMVLADYDGYNAISSGVSSYLSDAFSGLVIALIISFFLLFGVMACLFESVRKPCIIIFSFPFAFTGGFLALAITRVSLNVVSFIGLIMLMGVIINDAIVLNERIDQLKDSGMDKKEAVINGCRERLRAVLMTTLTTVLALIPMALGLGKGGALMQPLGIVAIGGMTVGTLVTLILIPSVYSLFYRIKFTKDSNEVKEEQ